MSFSEWIISRTGGQTNVPLFYTTCTCVELVHAVIIRVKIGKRYHLDDTLVYKHSIILQHAAPYNTAHRTNS